MDRSELKSFKRGQKVRIFTTFRKLIVGIVELNDPVNELFVINEVKDLGRVELAYIEIAGMALDVESIEEPLPWDDLSKMLPATFQALLDELDGNSLQTLKEKNARYAQNGDCLHNFRSGAEIAGGTPAQACWGYMTKHLVALRDMVERNDFSNREDFLEKCQDTINYIRFLWCIGNDK